MEQHNWTKERPYCIYMHTSPSGKVYIGQTCSKNLQYRWNYGEGYKGCIIFHKAIEKYGWNNIKHEILAEGLTKDEANQLEVKYIAEAKQKGISYNMSDGGCEMTENDRKRISESLKGRFAGPNSPTYGMIGPNTGRVAIHKDKTTIYVNNDELSKYEELGWKVGLSESHKKNISNAFIGRIWVKKDNQTAQIEPEKLNEYLENGWVRGRISTEKWCKPCTEEKKQKIGQSNSGGCYIHKDGICKHIPTDEISKYLSEGWLKGQLKPSADVFKQKMKGRIFVHKQDGTQKMIFEDRFSEYEKDGWSKGRFKKQKL